MIDKLLQKKNVLSNNYLFWVITVFIIFVPIFLSFNNIDEFSFSYIYYPKPSTEYLFTLPISFFFIIPFILLGLLNFYKDIEISILLTFVLISSINFFIYRDFQILLLLIKIAFPILILFGLEIYFKKKFQLLKKKNIIKVIKEYNYKFVLTFLIIFLITILSPFFIENKYGWLINGITIFNYFQYFPLPFILLLGMLAQIKQRYVFLLVYILSFYLFHLTTNMTFLILLVFFGINYLFSFLKKGYFIFLSKNFIILIFLIIFFYPFFLFLFFYLDLLQTDLNYNYSIISRLNTINTFFSNLNLIEFLTPIKMSSEIISKFYHNEFIVITSALGFLGSFLFYFVLFKRIWFISNYYPYISVAISLYAILTGVTVTVNLHPYTYIISSFFISYYYILSKIKSQQPL